MLCAQRAKANGSLTSHTFSAPNGSAPDILGDICGRLN
jgi:hypothetical protein